MKGFLSFSSLAFTHVLPDATTSKLCEILLGIVFIKFMVYLAEEISDFRLLCAFFFHGNSCSFSENFKLVSQGMYNPFVVPPVTTGEGLDVSSGRGRGGLWEKECGV